MKRWSVSTFRREFRYELDDDLKPVEVGGRYLDPEAAAASIEAVKMQGKK